MRSERGRARGERGAAPVRLVIGLVVVALGVVFLGENLGWLEKDAAFAVLWPAALVVLGLAVLFEPRRRGASRLWGVAWILAGALVWANRQAWIEVDLWDLAFPALLVALGLSLVGRALGGRRRERGGRESEADVRSFAFMSGNELRSASSDFRRADLGAVMGGVTLDLTQAKLAGEEAEIEVFAIWGGIAIRVPPEWSVTSRVVPLLAGYEDKTQPVPGANPRRVVVRGLVVMGGVEVSN